jgi:hypothetical protein
MGIPVRLCIALYFLRIWAFTEPVSAQIRRPDRPLESTTRLEGLVSDASQAAVANVQVIATNQTSGEQRGAVSGPDGSFSIRNIPPGTYTVVAVKAGWRARVLPDITIALSELKHLDVMLPADEPTVRTRDLPRPAGVEPTSPALPRELPGADADAGRVFRPSRSNPNAAVSERAPVPDFQPVGSRWTIRLPQTQRYDGGEDYPYGPRHIWDPYNQNVLKGDFPILGDHWFGSLTIASDTQVEGRRVPVAAPPSSIGQNESNFFGRGGQAQFSQNLAISGELFRGVTVFRPVDFRFRVTPVLNGNYLAARETGVVSIDVRQGHTRWDSYLPALQEAFAEVRAAEISPNFDFLSVRAGTQGFNSDFRGFIFADNEPGVRVFGNLKSNRYQYNAAYFHMVEKDTNSGLNKYQSRHQNVAVANFYMQDFIRPGYTTQFSVHLNNDKPSFHIDENGFLARPAPIGEISPKSINAIYLGWAGDGHLGRLNLSHAFYQVLGRERDNPLSGNVFGTIKGEINAQMAAAEVSVDSDWRRYRASVFYASGDDNPSDKHSRGFDSIFDNVQFAGGEFSFWNRQAIRLTGTGVGLTQRFSLNPSLRTSKDEGQANYVNPGLYLANAGFDAEVTPKLKLTANVNALAFAHTEVLQTLLFQPGIRRSIGVDTSIGARWRPLLSNNIVLTGGIAALVPGRGFRDIYTSRTLFSSFMELRLVY